MCKVKIIDSIPGSGKTSAIIQMINDDLTNDNKYIYITPFLTEVERIKRNCKTKRFYEPKYNQYGNKFDNLNKLIAEGKNIVSTHALFHKANLTTVELLKNNNYILILDEVFNVIKQLNEETGDNVSLKDIHMLINDGYAKIENDFLIWNESKEYQGQFENIRYLSVNKSIMIYGDNILMWTFPVEIFKAFKDTYILTYLFKAQEQCYYYQMNNIDYEFYYAYLNKETNTYKIQIHDNNYKSIENKLKVSIIKNLEIIQDDKLNMIGDSKFALSSSWYKNKDNEFLIKQLRNNLINYFCNVTKAKSKEVLWTTFKSQQIKLKGKGYTKGFIPINIRATNDYSDRYILAYTVNVFNNPIIERFFRKREIIINQDLFAVSELIQWIWRSRIRKGENIILYIPSSRMRDLLIDWLTNTLTKEDINEFDLLPNFI